MAEDATQEPSAQPGQSPTQNSVTVASACDQTAIATTFHGFSFLPEEIRRQIWQYASVSTRMHVLDFPRGSVGLPPVGPLKDPASAPYLNYPGLRNDLATLISSSENSPGTWGVSRHRKFRKFFWRCDLNRIGAVCPEAREVYLDFRQRIEQSRLKLKKGVHVNDSFDIFHFDNRSRDSCMTNFLLTMRPRLSPINIAIEVDFRVPNSTFVYDQNEQSVLHNFPLWLSKAIEWGREAAEGYENSPANNLTPAIDDVMIDLQGLQAVFLLDPAITFRGESRPLAHQYNVLAYGMDSRSYGISPGNEEIMKYWDVPAHTWSVLDEMKKVLKCSDDWKVNVYLMASIRIKTRPVKR